MSGTHHTTSDTTTDRTSGPAKRRMLRREIPGTVGLLADPGDFAAMRRYGSFAFDDHQDYLRHVDDLLRSLAAQGIHTTVALFEPEAYAEFCAEQRLDPDSPASRSRYTAELAGTGPGLPYTGRPIEEIVPLLMDEAVRQATWEYATTLLSDVGTCADCGEDIGRSSFERAADVLTRLVRGAGPGHHHLVCSIPTQDQQLVAVLHTETPPPPPGRPPVTVPGPDAPGGRGDSDATPWFDGRESLDFVTVLAAGLALGGPGGLVLRTTGAGSGDRVHGWRLDRGRLVALSAAAVFNAYCTDADTGEPVAPEHGVEYCPGYEVDGPDPHHGPR
ncbi:hypothetical protein ACFV2Q_05710 [Streptomyces sp. NPDC059650]|uniref:hypothetical protein n=1 Tax=Streptomyces sp. NPDC059650 TaxID=3346896 RepID=UPI0036BBBCD1